MLQDQRVKRLAKNFDLQKRELERRMEHEAFQEEMQRRILARRAAGNDFNLERPSGLDVVKTEPSIL